MDEGKGGLVKGFSTAGHDPENTRNLDDEKQKHNIRGGGSAMEEGNVGLV